jgi:hypothetical protein
MRISGPQRYKLTFDANHFNVTCEIGTSKFSGLATSKKPKLYIVSADDKPFYFGITKQSLRNRLRFGFSAAGEGGYHGYAWRRSLIEANLDVWCHEDAPDDELMQDIETVEAEVVFLIRCTGQWPQYQTEIHFHHSQPVHRKTAEAILARYGRIRH